MLISTLKTLKMSSLLSKNSGSFTKEMMISRTTLVKKHSSWTHSRSTKSSMPTTKTEWRLYLLCSLLVPINLASSSKWKPMAFLIWTFKAQMRALLSTTERNTKKYRLMDWETTKNTSWMLMVTSTPQTLNSSQTWVIMLSLKSNEQI